MTYSSPYDIEAFKSVSPIVRWPLDFSTVKVFNRALRESLIDSVLTHDDPEMQEILAIATPGIMIALLTEGCVVLNLARAATRGLTFQPLAESLAADILNGKAEKSGQIYDLISQRFSAANGLSWRNFARDMAHGIITNGGIGVGQQSVLILNHNRLLQSTARAAKKKFHYRSSGRLFSKRHTPIERSLRDRCREVGSLLVDNMRKVLERFEAPLKQFHAEVLSQKTAQWLEKVAQDRASLDENLDLGRVDLWTGTGGNYINRQIRAAVKRGGGRVTGFEHGGGGHIHRELGSEVVNEFWFLNSFIADTAAKAGVYREGAETSGFKFKEHPTFDGAASGLASFSWNNEKASPVKKILYATTAFVGETCYPIQPLLPDPIYADWQGRMADGLAAQGFEVLIKQHPQGLMRGEHLITSRHGVYVGGRFEDAARQADAFVFDYPATTTLWEALCTRKPVLFIDFGLADWNPKVRELFERRCAIVRGEFDEWNRPQADFAAMRRAISNAPLDDTFAASYLTGLPRQ